METLYICIDESGVPVLAIVLPSPDAGLDLTVTVPKIFLSLNCQKLLSKAATFESLSSPPSELKGKDYDSPTLGRLINQLKADYVRGTIRSAAHLEHGR